MMSSARARADAKKAEGNEYFKNQKYDNAIKSYTEAIDLDPSNHVYFSNRSAAYLGKNMYQEACADGEECVHLSHTFVKGYHRYALALKGLKKYIKALEILKAGQKVDFNNKDLNKLLNEVEPLALREEEANRSDMPRDEQLKLKGNDAFKLAQFDKAISLYTEALDASKDKTSKVAISCYNNRAACYQQVSNYGAVIADCTMVLEVDTENQKALLRRALSYEGLERYRLALQDIRALLQINPNIEAANKAQHRIGSAVRTLKQQKN